MRPPLTVLGDKAMQVSALPAMLTCANLCLQVQHAPGCFCRVQPMLLHCIKHMYHTAAAPGNWLQHLLCLPHRLLRKLQQQPHHHWHHCEFVSVCICMWCNYKNPHTLASCFCVSTCLSMLSCTVQQVKKWARLGVRNLLPNCFQFTCMLPCFVYTVT